jgi:hypothetical protein
VPQFDFFATWNDDWVLLQRLLSVVPASLVPDKWYRDKTLVLYKDVDTDLQAQLAQRRRVFLVPEGTPLNVDAGFVMQKSGPKGGWYRIEPNLLGETLELTLPACFDNAGTTCLGSGSLTRAREYFNHESRTWQSPSESLKTFYTLVRKVLQKNLISDSVGASTAWMGMEAKQLVDAGLAKITDRGL